MLNFILLRGAVQLLKSCESTALIDDIHQMTLKDTAIFSK